MSFCSCLCTCPMGLLHNVSSLWESIDTDSDRNVEQWSKFNSKYNDSAWSMRGYKLLKGMVSFYKFRCAVKRQFQTYCVWVNLLMFFFVCIIRNADIHSEVYGLPAVICARKFFFHFVFLSIKSAVVCSWSPYTLTVHTNAT